MLYRESVATLEGLAGQFGDDTLRSQYLAAENRLLAYDGLGDVIGAFAGAGVWEFDAFRGWFQLTAANATVLATG